MKDLSFDQFGIRKEEKDLKKVKGNQEPKQLMQLGCGTILEVPNATCVYPLQVIMTRTGAQYSNTNASYSCMSDAFWRTLGHEVSKDFQKGLLPVVLKAVSLDGAPKQLKAAIAVVAKGLLR